MLARSRPAQVRSANCSCYDRPHHRRRDPRAGGACVETTAAGDLEELGELLRHHRLAAGLTKQARAEQAGRSARGIAELQRRTRDLAYVATQRPPVARRKLP